MKKKGTRRTYTKQITHPYIFVSRNGLLCLELVVKGRTYYKVQNPRRILHILRSMPMRVHRVCIGHTYQPFMIDLLDS